jgi:transcription termination/antitermination protein NusG
VTVRMQTVCCSEAAVGCGEALAARFGSEQWYAAHLHANREKRAAEELRWRGVEHFLPLYASVRRWKDRRVTLDLPLFPGYLFVRIRLADRLRVLSVPGVARLVGCAGVPTSLPDAELESLREKLSQGMRAEPYPYLALGRRVRVIRGPMQGVEGFLVSRRKRSRIVISIDSIERSIAAEVEAGDVEPTRGPRELAVFDRYSGEGPGRRAAERSLP